MHLRAVVNSAQAQQTAAMRGQELKSLTSKHTENQAELKSAKQQHKLLVEEEAQLTSQVKTSMVKLEEAKSTSQGSHARSQVASINEFS